MKTKVTSKRKRQCNILKIKSKVIQNQKEKSKKIRNQI